MLEDLETFYTIVKTGSFTKAAKELGVSTPMVTRRLARLEKNLGTRLIHRNTRKLSITEPGVFFFQEAKEILQKLDNSKKQLLHMRQEVVGTLKIGIPITLNHLYLSPQLKTFLVKHPGLNMRIVNGNHLLDLLDNDFDVVIHCSNLPDSNFHFKKLGYWKKVICASPEYIQKHGTPNTPEELNQHNCLDHYDNLSSSWQFKNADRIQEVFVKGNVKANSSIDLKNLAVSGTGIVYIPCFAADHELRTGKLISVLQAYQPPEIGMYAVYPSQQFLSKKVQVFLEFFSEIMAPVLSNEF